MNNYYKEEWFNLIDSWSVDQIDQYIEDLKERVTHTRQQMYELQNLRRRKLRNKSLKDTGTRGGK